MTGARHFARQHARDQIRALRERREYERAARLDMQDEQLANTKQPIDNGGEAGVPMYRCACGRLTKSRVCCEHCYQELGGES